MGNNVAAVCFTVHGKYRNASLIACLNRRNNCIRITGINDDRVRILRDQILHILHLDSRIILCISDVKLNTMLICRFLNTIFYINEERVCLRIHCKSDHVTILLLCACLFLTLVGFLLCFALCLCCCRCTGP